MITQKINLYRAQVGSEPDLSFFKILEICGVFAVALLFYSLVLWGMEHHQVTNINKIKAEEMALANQLMQKNATFNIEDQKKKLQADIDKLTDDRDQKKLLLDTLAAQGFNQQQGFSRFLEGLAQNHVDGTWITSIIIQGGGSNIALSGSAVRAKLVPLIFQGLSQDPSYQGKAFETIVIQKKNEVVDKKENGKKTDMAAPLKTNKNQVDFEAKTEGIK